ncbi:GlsB/YeaQ/YmgE family stress response membrane protein [Mycobacterium simiae]|uniref:GlsB/YeaQ/YmgE family stress response membrane protein n=1 Tax=Mycobacterium simiae TaxID=1784 RepID=A0A5B1BW49_MYCSI|nr:GlsB/YeaQ/YmgE family stress response membrane protein [Mycobacterium simiae]KAA1251640.1 GlsB/YeaQ/YmgE family stress response membrane protein [Mycobacterium simiae]
MFWTILTAIIGGLIIGALARWVMPGKQDIGVFMTILLGIAGSFIGSWICYNVFDYQNQGGGWAVVPFLVGILVAVVLIAIYLGVTGRSRRARRAM